GVLLPHGGAGGARAGGSCSGASVHAEVRGKRRGLLRQDAPRAADHQARQRLHRRGAHQRPARPHHALAFRGGASAASEPTILHLGALGARRQTGGVDAGQGETIIRGGRFPVRISPPCAGDRQRTARPRRAPPPLPSHRGQRLPSPHPHPTPPLRPTNRGGLTARQA
ncbi:hypothetical protein T484DRAFT_1918012, partial [Baffinella frigidus]